MGSETVAGNASTAPDHWGANELDAPPPRRPVQWRRAWAQVQAIRNNTADAVDSAYALADSLGGMCDERLFRKFKADPAGRRLLAERPSLPDILADHDSLARLPEGSFGRAYLAQCQRININAAGLIESQHNMSRDFGRLDPARQWFSDRLTVMHDLWHVISGYATQPRGEAAIVAFSFGQGITYRAIPIFIILSVLTGTARARELWQAYWRSRRTANLILQPYEDLLALPLSEVRARVMVSEARTAHAPRIPEGLLT